MALLMILLPLALAALALAFPVGRGRPWRPWLIPFAGCAQMALVLAEFSGAKLAPGSRWLALDPPGRIVLLLVSVLYLFCAFYAVGYLRSRNESPNRVFCACLLASLGGMDLVVWSQHLGVMWVAVEGTTLLTAPLIYFKRTRESIEATWKYLLVGSVGIAMALLGTFFLAYALIHVGLDAPLTMEALLAGGVTSCAFLALVRITHVVNAAGEGAFTSRLLLFLGLFSMAVAAVFVAAQRDFKRMLAYSSVEHMGILALGLGLGRPALYGTMLHILTNGLTKGVLFLSAGNIHRAYGSKNTDQVRGVLRRLPVSGTLFFLGFLAITGSPPFGPFVSEFSILKGSFAAGRFLIGGAFLVLLMAIFAGMSRTVLRAVQGKAPASGQKAEAAGP
ncbi:MAG: proton-conducting transporter membrane subunit, partial [Humidesulfovibrio sp.]|nr:proton-conducting transporter membrane subunit [Humidesulfovibrio sp.]